MNSKKLIIIHIISIAIMFLFISCVPKDDTYVSTTGSNTSNESIIINNDINEPHLSIAIKAEPNNTTIAKIEPELTTQDKKPEPNAILQEKSQTKIPEPNTIEKPKAVSFNNKYNYIFQNFVDEDGLVDYKRLKRKRLELKSLLNNLRNLNPKAYNNWPKEEKIAFWINAYNIHLTKILLDNYPIKSSRWFRLFYPPSSIRHISGIWDSYKIIIMNEEFTLNEIENRFFIKQFDDPKIFLVLSKGSLSGPSLKNQPYYGKNLGQQLDNQVKKFLSNPNNFKIDRTEKIVYLSAILEPSWYGKNFINKFGTLRKFKEHPAETRAVLNFLINRISESDISFLEVQNYSIKYITYDWRLNDK